MSLADVNKQLHGTIATLRDSQAELEGALYQIAHGNVALSERVGIKTDRDLLQWMQREARKALEGKRISVEISHAKDAFRLLSLISYEFQSDPMSIQCFDFKAVVNPVNSLVAKWTRETP